MDSTNHGSKTVFSYAEGLLFVFFYAILQKGLEHPQILVFVRERVLDTGVPNLMLRVNCIAKLFPQ